MVLGRQEQEQAAGLKAEGWGEANKTTKERGAAQAEMLLLRCIACCSRDPIRIVISSSRPVELSLWSVEEGWHWHAKTTRDERLLSRRSAAKPHAAVSPYSLRLDGWSGYYFGWFFSRPVKTLRIFHTNSCKVALHCNSAVPCYTATTVYVRCIML